MWRSLRQSKLSPNTFFFTAVTRLTAQEPVKSTAEDGTTAMGVAEAASGGGAGGNGGGGPSFWAALFAAASNGVGEDDGNGADNAQ